MDDEQAGAAAPAGEHPAPRPVDAFYRAFEDLFRGERSVILARLEAYADVLAPLLSTSESSTITDLGCGRGEWLELCQAKGFTAYGVDSDAGMLAACREAGMAVEQGDALTHLRRLPDASRAAISGFHLAEHVPFAVLQELVTESLRVLEPGGLLILETPNPENPRVATLHFHMDPSHLSPIPPALLAFLPLHHGFARSRVIRLQESADLRTGATATLMDVLEGASPDYAMLAQKDAAPEVMTAFDAVFAAPRGLTVEALAKRFEAGLATKAEMAALREELTAGLAAARAQITAAEKRVANAERRVAELQDSTSWKVTRPLRAVSGAAGKARRGARHRD